jgi:hypothetical protein
MDHITDDGQGVDRLEEKDGEIFRDLIEEDRCNNNGKPNEHGKGSFLENAEGRGEARKGFALDLPKNPFKRVLWRLLNFQKNLIVRFG